MLQDPNVERIIENRIKPLQDEITLLKDELIMIKRALNIDIVSKSVCECETPAISYDGKNCYKCRQDMKAT